MALNPNFSQQPKLGVGLVSTANTNRDGTGILAIIFTAGAIGSKLERARVMALSTTTAGMVRLFLHDGVNAHLFDEIAVPAVVPSGTVQAFKGDIDWSTSDKALWLPAGWSLRASTHNAESFKVIAVAGDLS